MTTLDNAILVYDINTLPYGLSMEQILEIYHTNGLVLFNGIGSKSIPPTIFTADREVLFKIVDSSKLSAKEVKELIDSIHQTYEVIQEEEFPDLCNMDGKAVSKYVYYVRKILFITAPMSGEWLQAFEEAKDKIRFPRLTDDQLYNLRLEELNKNIKK